MRVIALIEVPTVIERILSWLGLWEPLQPTGPSPPAPRASRSAITPCPTSPEYCPKRRSL
jgi:hypothetical protein